jgi:hypothetical protein
MEEGGSERRAQIWAVGSRSNGQNGDMKKKQITVYKLSLAKQKPN